MFGHHPLIVEELAVPGHRRATRSTPTQAATILGDYARDARACSCTTPGTRTATSARSARSRPSVTHQEIAAGKEYPGGFSLLRLHTGGFALNFYKTRSDLARAWSERSRQEIVGFWPQFALGASVSDRNTVVAHDLSALRPIRGATSTTLPSTVGSPATTSAAPPAGAAAPVAAQPTFTG